MWRITRFLAMSMLSPSNSPPHALVFRIALVFADERERSGRQEKKPGPEGALVVVVIPQGKSLTRLFQSQSGR